MDNGDDVLAEEAIDLSELAAPAPDENPDEQGIYRHENLESNRTRPQSPKAQERQPHRGQLHAISRWHTQLCIVSYLIFFSIFGVLARLGLQAITSYSGAPIANTDLWANFGGSMLMGMLREDRMLFRRHWREALAKARLSTRHSSSDDEMSRSKDINDAAKVSFASAKGSTPAYIGLTVGFCGSFTSFASICRDTFLAMANDFGASPVSRTATTGSRYSRPAGGSVMAVLAILILEVGLSIVALQFGAHVAVALRRPAEKVPVFNVSRYMNALIAVLGPGCWLGATLLTIWPVHDAWRGQALFAVVFAPIGCFLRFQLSVHMNRLVRKFPVGTFVANIAGSCVLGMAYNLQMTSTGSAVLSCQVLQGIMDGFCGALTTVSTWVLELGTLRVVHAYVYGLCSLVIGVGLITAIMGPLKWTEGFSALTCKT